MPAPRHGRWQLPESGRVLLLPDVPAPRSAEGPSLMPLLALWLAREGLHVLVHRPGAPDGRDAGPDAASVLRSLGILPTRDADDVADRWARREPAVLATDLLEPPAPPGADWRFAAPRGPRRMLHLVPCAGPADEDVAARWARSRGTAMLRLAGPWPSDLRHCPALDVWIDGQARPELGDAASDAPPGHWAPMPHQADATAMALFAQDVLSGVRPMPGPLRQLADRVCRAMDALAPPLADTPLSCL